MTETDQFPKLVRDLMTVGVVTCPAETPAAEVARLLLENHLEAVVVLEPLEGHALGVVSRLELVKAYTLPGAGDLTAEDIMVAGVPQVPSDIPILAAVQIMLDLGVRTLFFMHHAGGIEYPAASISFSHILRHLGAKDADELKDLGLQAERKSPIETFIARRDAARRRHAGDKP
jgi:CBS domain-containing protein